MTWKEPTREEQEASAAAADARELHRLQTLARHARSLLADLDVALGHAMTAADVYKAVSYLRGPSSTFARGIVDLVQLA